MDNIASANPKEITENMTTGVITNGQPIPQTSLLYASAVSQSQHPSREQAIVIDAIQGVTITEYMLRIGSAVDPKNLIAISRISGNRVCAFLSSTALVDKLTSTENLLSIGECLLRIKPLVSQSKRIVLSGVCPSLPHSMVEKKFGELGIKIMSAPKFIKVGSPNPEYAHVISHRRELYIDQLDVNKLPDTMTINYNGKDLFIFSSLNNPVCFNCKKPGHFAKNCPSNDTGTQTTVETMDISDQHGETRRASASVSSSSTLNIIDNFPPLPSKTASHAITRVEPRDPLPSKCTRQSAGERELTDSYNTRDDTSQKDEGFVLPKTKKTRTSRINRKRHPEDFIRRHTTRLQENISKSPVSFQWSYDEFVQILLKWQGESNSIALGQPFTDEPEKLSLFLSKCYIFIDDRLLKGHVTELKNSLVNLEYESDSCHSST